MRKLHPTHRRGLYATVALATVLLLGAAARPELDGRAFHLRLVRSDPARDTTITAAPTAIRLWFSQTPTLAVTSVRLTGPGGRAVALAPLQRDAARGAPVVALLRGQAGVGRYTVSWRTMSPDGHPVRGTFGFTVAASPGT